MPTPPAGTGFVGPVALRARSAAGVTVVVTLAPLFVVTGSISAAVTLAMSVMAPATFACPRMVTVAFAPLASTPRLQVITVAAIEHVPWLGAMKRNATPAGRVLVSVTPLAAEGP